MKITDIHNPWRDYWRQASFNGVPFYVEVGGEMSGRRIIVHQFPKKALPFSEDMGRNARRFRITGYIISYMRDVDDFIQRDYRIPRDKLRLALEDEGAGELVHPTLGTLMVVAGDYSVSEDRTKGGYCVFEMEFHEAGVKPNNTLQISTQSNVNSKADAAADTVGQEADRALAQ